MILLKLSIEGYRIIQGHHRIMAMQHIAIQSGKPLDVQATDLQSNTQVYIHIEPNTNGIISPNPVSL